MLLLGNIPWTMATPNVDLNDLDNHEIPQKRAEHKALTIIGGFFKLAKNSKFQWSQFLRVSPMIYKAPNLVVSAFQTSPDNHVYLSVYDKVKLYPVAVFHVIHPVVVNRPKRPKSIQWKEDTQMVPLSGNPSEKIDGATSEDFKQIYQELIPNFKKGIRYYARGHLAPCGDFSTIEEQEVTFFLSNAAPMSQPLNGHKWLAMERVLRLYSDTYQKELFIITLCSGEMLDGSTSQALKLHDRVTVPRWFGKVIIDPYTNECVMVSAENDIQGGDIFLWDDLNHNTIRQMFPEQIGYLELDCNPSGKPNRMIRAVKQLAPSTFELPKN